MRIKGGEIDAWNELIGAFEGRLLGYVESRLRRRDTSEDVVQETFIGFLTSLPNYDLARSLESYLFSIAAHKMTDHLRREGRRPALPLSQGATSDGSWHLPSSECAATAILRSGDAGIWSRNRWPRRWARPSMLAGARRVGKNQMRRAVGCGGWANKDVALHLGLSEQQVANQKFDLLVRLRSTLKKQGVSEDVFPELYDE